jgi:hypothetical protein
VTAPAGGFIFSHGDASLPKHKSKNLSLSYDIFQDFANEMHLSLAEKGINEKRSPLSLRGAKRRGNP